MSRPIADREQRAIPLAGLEVRVSSPGQPPKIEGYAAVFNQPSEIISDMFGSFREYVAPGAFTKTLKDGADVRALLNHDPNFVLGRSKSGTLRLWEDSRGLGYEATPPDTQWARDLLEVMRRGDIDQSSFGFRTVRDRWGVGKTDGGDEVDERTLLELQLFDVSPVTYPAYPQTTSDVRSLPGGLTPAEWRELYQAVVRGQAVPVQITNHIAARHAPAPTVPVPSGHAADELSRWLERHLKYLDDPHAA
jgi:HK97 family phage prohead protease